MEEIKVGKQTFHVLFPKLLRPLTPKEERDLDASILQYGVKYAVHTDEENGIIDGANRCRLASKHNLPIQVRAHRGLSLEEKRQLALSLNLDRRHITQKEREQAKAERVELAAQKHREGEPTRQIAKELGVSQTQAQEDIGAAGEQGCSPAAPPPAVKGKDGKQYPAHRATQEEIAERRERVAALRAEGCTTREICEEEGISERQVRSDLQALRHGATDVAPVPSPVVATAEPESAVACDEEPSPAQVVASSQPTPLDIAKEAWRRMDQAQRTEFTHWMYSSEANS
ncbi:MAG TPA: hypothetical protein VEL76_24305 [Gemmataceae bacterium]|nr:hypothetical protein [Gemmataceae bacterium]